jgi:hypothetical protein
MKIRNKFLYTLLVINLLICSACSAVNSTSPREKSDLDYLQKQVSFEIIMPSYFPSGLSHNPVNHLGPAQGLTGPDDEPEIRMDFANGTAHFMMINEYYEGHSVAGGDVDFEINGITIYEQTGLSLSSLNPGNNTNVYIWTLNGIYFEVWLTGYNETVCRKVISSMIPQETTTTANP